MTKTKDIADLIAQDKSNKEIKETVGCSSGLISQVRKKIPKEDMDEITPEEQEDFDNTPNGGFIKEIKLTPDSDTLTDKKDEKVKSFDVECPECRHEWSVNSDEHIDTCPNCNTEFE